MCFVFRHVIPCEVDVGNFARSFDVVCYFAGSISRVRKVVSTTTHVMENDEPVVEVTIGPREMQESMQRTTRTTTTSSSRTSNRSEHDTSVDYTYEQDAKAPRSPNGYLIDENRTTVTQSTRGESKSAFFV